MGGASGIYELCVGLESTKARVEFKAGRVKVEMDQNADSQRQE